MRTAPNELVPGSFIILSLVQTSAPLLYLQLFIVVCRLWLQSFVEGGDQIKPALSLFIHCLALLKSLHPDTHPMIPLFPPSCWSSVSSSEDKRSTYQSEKQILRPREASRPPNSWSVLGSHCQFQRCLSRVTLNGKTRKPKRFTAALTSGVIWWLQANTDIPHYTLFLASRI